MRKLCPLVLVLLIWHSSAPAAQTSVPTPVRSAATDTDAPISRMENADAAPAACPLTNAGFTRTAANGPIKRDFGSGTVANLIPGTETLPGAGMNSANVFYPDAYGASGSTATIVAATTANSKLIVASGGVGDFKVSHGVHIMGAGPAVAYSGATLNMPTCVGSPCTGTHSYSWVVINADPLGGMSAAGPVVTKTSMPAINTLGYAQYFKMSGTQVQFAPVGLYLIYCSYDGGTYQFVFVDNSIVHPGTADFGQRPADGRGWPVTLTGGASFTGRKEDFFSYITGINGLNITLNDSVRTSLAKAIVLHDDTLASQRAEEAAEAAGGGRIQWGPHTYNIEQPAFWNNSAWVRTISGAVAAYPPRLFVESSNMDFTGMGAGVTTIYSRPDEYTFGGLFGFGMDRTEPWAHRYYAMIQVNQGDTKVRLTTPSDSSHFAVGDDVFLFFGAFQTSCPAVDGRPGNNCEFDELNSITSIDRPKGIIYLKYPATLTFRSDGTNPFGILDLNPTTQSYHHIAIHDINFDVESPIMLPRLVFDGQFYNLTALSGMNAGWQYIGLNRRFDFHDNRFVIGDGSGAFHSMEELDHADDYTFTNNVFIWNVAPGVAGSYVNYGMVLTEGTEAITFCTTDSSMESWGLSAMKMIGRSSRTKWSTQ